jgi:hypothetical protein
MLRCEFQGDRRLWNYFPRRTSNGTARLIFYFSFYAMFVARPTYLVELFIDHFNGSLCRCKSDSRIHANGAREKKQAIVKVA